MERFLGLASPVGLARRSLAFLVLLTLCATSDANDWSSVQQNGAVYRKPGVLTYRSASYQHKQVVPFDVVSRGALYTIINYNGKRRQLNTPGVDELMFYPEIPDNLMGDAGIRHLQQVQRSTEAFVQRHPSASRYFRASLSSISNALKQYASGMRRRNGQWVHTDQLEKEQREFAVDQVIAQTDRAHSAATWDKELILNRARAHADVHKQATDTGRAVANRTAMEKLILEAMRRHPSRTLSQWIELQMVLSEMDMDHADILSAVEKQKAFSLQPGDLEQLGKLYDRVKDGDDFQASRFPQVAGLLGEWNALQVIDEQLGNIANRSLSRFHNFGVKPAEGLFLRAQGAILDEDDQAKLAQVAERLGTLTEAGILNQYVAGRLAARKKYVQRLEMLELTVPQIKTVEDLDAAHRGLQKRATAIHDNRERTPETSLPPLTTMEEGLLEMDAAYIASLKHLNDSARESKKNDKVIDAIRQLRELKKHLPDPAIDETISEWQKDTLGL